VVTRHPLGVELVCQHPEDVAVHHEVVVGRSVYQLVVPPAHDPGAHRVPGLRPEDHQVGLRDGLGRGHGRWRRRLRRWQGRQILHLRRLLGGQVGRDRRAPDPAGSPGESNLPPAAGLADDRELLPHPGSADDRVGGART